MSERWFTDEELTEMSRPTMDRVIEAIDAGDLEGAKRLCEEMKHEWRFLHDMMVDGIAASITWVKERLGEEAVGVLGADQLEVRHRSILRKRRR